MVVRQSEFARMCGVSPAAIGIAVKRGRLVKTAKGRIDTAAALNKAYLQKRLLKTRRKENRRESEWNAGASLASSVYSQAGMGIVAACKSIIRYVEEQERERALAARVIHKPIDLAAVNFLRDLTDKIAATAYDNQHTHDALLMAMNEDYRLCYMNALAQSRKRAAGGVTPAIPIPGKARAGRKGLNQSV